MEIKPEKAFSNKYGLFVIISIFYMESSSILFPFASDIVPTPLEVAVFSMYYNSYRKEPHFPLCFFHPLIWGQYDPLSALWVRIAFRSNGRRLWQDVFSTIGFLLAHGLFAVLF